MGECKYDLELTGLVLDIILEGIVEAMEAIVPILFIACTLLVGALELARSLPTRYPPRKIRLPLCVLAAQAQGRPHKYAFRSGFAS